ncbi:MAG: 16S rRNA (cytosine(967)-C(5))-methyltransferase RsmB [Oscillospiraceae bacterium]|nr:16S rRNA (cytosine(967)-C(5))-methyltransferase RsmB [Oscillospiraceae bacterium]
MPDRSPRAAVADLLIKVSKNAYSNLALDGALQKSSYTPKEKAFISRLFYGVIERRITLDYIISLYSTKPLQKLDGAVLTVLRMGVYQIVFMDSVPDNAAVNESVELVKQLGKSSAASFVNAVLRNFIRSGKTYALPEKSAARMSVKYSCPEELVSRFTAQYGEKRTAEFLEASLRPHKLYLRVNNTKISADKLIELFAETGIGARKCDVDENCIEADSFGSVESNELFMEGYYHVQDMSSQLCCMALDPKKNDRILDICAAPGGKTFTIAEMTGDECKLYSCDLHSKRVELIRSGAERLGLKSITPLQNDAKVFNSNLGVFDKILCDVPCSGLGVIRSKPEIKYTDLSKIAGLPKVQYDILCTASEYLKPGGELVYSTCTVLKEENDDVIDRFLNEHSNFEKSCFLGRLGEPFGSYKTVMFAGKYDCEGFFISKIRRVK